MEAVINVTREHHWPPNVVGGLFCDDLDFEGLLFWSQDVIRMYKKKK